MKPEPQPTDVFSVKRGATAFSMTISSLPGSKLSQLTDHVNAIQSILRDLTLDERTEVIRQFLPKLLMHHTGTPVSSQQRLNEKVRKNQAGLSNSEKNRIEDIARKTEELRRSIDDASFFE